MPLAIISAIFITKLSLVFCNTIYSINPPTLTTPVILKSPISGKFLLTPKPGFNGPFFIIICPIQLLCPKDASMAKTMH